MSAFTPKTRRLVIERDGGMCQWCGELVRSDDYSLQHRRARGMGGSKDPVSSSPSNAVLMCGSGTTGCHGFVEANPVVAEGRGFRVRQGADPRHVPLWSWRGEWWFLLPDGSRVECEEPPF